MPILKNAKKALRASKRKAVFNQQVRSKMRTMVAKMQKSPAQEQLSETFSSIDKAVKRHLVHKNKAARLKSQMSAAVAKAK
jgi:small subunit ribosomal protein S20